MQNPFTIQGHIIAVADRFDNNVSGGSKGIVRKPLLILKIIENRDTFVVSHHRKPNVFGYITKEQHKIHQPGNLSYYFRGRCHRSSFDKLTDPGQDG